MATHKNSGGMTMGGDVAANESRWEVQWSPRYGAPFQMIYYAETQEACQKWLDEFGAHYQQNGAIQTVKA